MIATDARSALREAQKLISGPIADLLTGDSMNDTGAYDVLALIKAALADNGTVFAVHCPDNFEEPIFIFDSEDAAELFHDSKPGSFVTSEPVLDMQFAKEESE